MERPPTSSPSDDPSLESVLAYEQELERQVSEARERAERRVKQARSDAEKRVAQEKDLNGQACAARLEEQKSRLLRELAEATDERSREHARVVAGLDGLRTSLSHQVLQQVLGR